jgi:hypothetical protein
VPEPSPRRVVVTSSIRWAWVSEVSAFFRVLDLERGEVTFTAPVPESAWRAVDPNPRGGQRGARGVSATSDRLVIANSERLFVFDTSWRLLGQLTRRLTADVHEVLADDDGVWVTAAGCDLLLRLSWDGELDDWWSFRADKRLLKDLGFRRRPPRLDPDLDHRDPNIRLKVAPYDTAHLNDVVLSGNDLLVSFGRVQTLEEGPRSSAIVRLPRHDRARAAVVFQTDAPDVPNHNVAEDGDLLVYNDSNRNCLVAWDRRAGAERSAVSIPGDPPFARGLLRIGPSLWLVGSQQPAAVHAVDLDRAGVVATYALGGVENETVFGIEALPDTFLDPPTPAGDDPYAFWLAQPDGG